MLYTNDETRVLGRKMREERKRQGITQSELADALGVTREMVAQMELYGIGLDSVTTRRKVAKALGLSPVVFGVLGQDVKPQALYDTTILRTSLKLHYELYYTAGNVSLVDIDNMITGIFSISQNFNHRNKDVLRILSEYTDFGICIAREWADQLAIHKYISWSTLFAEKVCDPTILAAMLTDASSALYDIGDYQNALEYSQRALAVKKVPSHVQALSLLDMGRVKAKLGESDMAFVDKALTIVRNKPNEEDVANIRLNVGFCQIRKAFVLLDQGELEEVEQLLDDADVNTPTSTQRRRCMIQALQAELFLKQGLFDQAALTATDAARTAKQIHSQPNVKRVQNIYHKLLNSTHANSRDVRELGRLL